MKLEPRNTFGKPSLILIPETEEESRLIDEQLGKNVPVAVYGEVTLADGYGTHYISLKRDGT